MEARPVRDFRITFLERYDSLLLFPLAFLYVDLEFCVFRGCFTAGFYGHFRPLRWKQSYLVPTFLSLPPDDERTRTVATMVACRGNKSH